MGWYVHLHIAFEVFDAKRLVEVARAALPRADDAPPEAQQFLDAIASGGFIGQGRKGSLCTWGVVANYTSGRAFINTLSDIWPELYKEPAHNGPAVAEWCRIIVFEEQEQSGRACAYQIEWDGEAARVSEIDLPIAWKQY